MVVLLAVAGRCVHAASAGLEGDVVGEDDQRLAVDEGVLAVGLLCGLVVDLAQLLGGTQAAGLGHRGQQLLGHDQHLTGVGAAVGELHRHVGVGRVQRHGQVRRQGPGRRGPDHEGDLPVGQLGVEPGGVVQVAHLDVDRVRVVVLVLHLGLGQRRAAGGAPVHGLLALVEVALVGEVRQLAGDGGLVVLGQGQVGLVPRPQHTQALELLALDLHEALGVLAAGAPDLQRRHLGLLGAQVAVDLQLDGQAVAVPPRPVERAVPGHGAVLHHDVLEHLVEDVPVVDAPVGVGRPVVQHEERSPRGGRVDAVVQLLLGPPAQELRLPLPHVASHGELGLGQVQGGLERLLVHERSPAACRGTVCCGAPDVTRAWNVAKIPLVSTKAGQGAASCRRRRREGTGCMDTLAGGNLKV